MQPIWAEIMEGFLERGWLVAASHSQHLCLVTDLQEDLPKTSGMRRVVTMAKSGNGAPTGPAIAQQRNLPLHNNLDAADTLRCTC